ncbi:putative cyclase [Gottschalkia acidurici 9a]|uniref:Cyclase n=1 Tax=Gottschalkia acidurici (strain ATCC 7906 / DSM 604 / BCRC 14475 / CIP 104303 / KCTC 5404 / NCIMB 10678 / 9a) TaxID=1128398 RepID=K0B295_GOTA9|nr:cyclase family protein [Gottschalkia acidurici]AFS79050.1 putative cyclase [Gottschalkia acidurici 9a]
MVRYIDLSHNIVNNMPVHPYDDPIKLYQDKFLETDEYNNFKLEIGMHAGTHIDTPMHLTNSDTFINEITLDRFIGKGCILDVRNENLIGYKEEYSDIVCENDIVLIYTNHSEKYGTDDYFINHPIIDEKLIDFFIAKKIKMIGIDLPSPDKHPFEIHKMLFKHDIMIIENMNNLSELLNVKSFEIIAFPLKIKAEASMVRVVGKIIT